VGPFLVGPRWLLVKRIPVAPLLGPRWLLVKPKPYALAAGVGRLVQEAADRPAGP
jgi:hypothetical protein